MEGARNGGMSQGKHIHLHMYIYTYICMYACIHPVGGALSISVGFK